MKKKPLKIKAKKTKKKAALAGVAKRAKKRPLRRVAAGEALRQSEARFRALVETSPYGIQENDIFGLITYGNSAHANMLGRGAEGVVGKYIWDFVANDEERDELKRYFEYLVKEEPDPLPYFCKNQTADGRVIDVQVDWNYRRDANGRLIGFVSILTDITERRRAEEARELLQAQLLQSQKMEAVGRLSGGIVHDLNNIMTSVKTIISMGEEDAGELEPFKTYFADLKSAYKRATGFTEKLSLFSRNSPVSFTRVDLNAVVEDGLLSVFANMLGDGVSISYDLDRGAPSVKADRSNVEQLIMNLVINARDAVGEGGRITVSTSNAVVDSKKCRVCGRTCNGRFVKLSVEDDGVGMDAATLERIFDPFFTTKEPGKGTGLGLSVVYGIVESHGGCLDVKSEPGRGTTFDVYLPICDDECEISAAVMGEECCAKGVSCRILLVEDDELVRSATRMLLERNGYAVTAAASISEAQVALKGAKERFDLVLSDMVLPDGTGLDLCKELRLKMPKMRFILFSGYADHRVQQQEIVRSGIRFLSKPFETSDLLSAVRETMTNGR